VTALAAQTVPVRRREVTWDDPHLGAALAQQMSGLDYLRALRDGRIPRPPLEEVVATTAQIRGWFLRQRRAAIDERRRKVIARRSRLAVHPNAEPVIPLTSRLRWLTIDTPMARMLTAAKTLRGTASLSFRAYACLPGPSLDHEQRPGRRESANTGRPDARW
jgi:hypothetical protein